MAVAYLCSNLGRFWCRNNSRCFGLTCFRHGEEPEQFCFQDQNCVGCKGSFHPKLSTRVWLVERLVEPRW